MGDTRLVGANACYGWNVDFMCFGANRNGAAGSVAGSPARATHTGAAARSEELSIVSREFIGRDIRPIANGNVAPRFAHHLDFAQWKTDIDD